MINITYSNLGKYFRSKTDEEEWQDLARELKRESCDHERVAFLPMGMDYCGKCYFKMEL